MPEMVRFWMYENTWVPFQIIRKRVQASGEVIQENYYTISVRLLNDGHVIKRHKIKHEARRI